MDEGDRAFSSAAYWEERYRSGGNSGAGSYGRLAEFKGSFLNQFFEANDVESVLEFGCGDGNQLRYMSPKRYIGFDVSPAAIDICRRAYADVSAYEFYSPQNKPDFKKYDLTLSLDVMFHLVEDNVFSRYVDELFSHSSRFVVIYSSNFDAPWPDKHVIHRNVVNFVKSSVKGWRLLCVVPNAYPYRGDDVRNTSFCDFLIYGKAGSGCTVICPEVHV
jgi:SAM-dependent methyltransferase